MEFYRPEKNFNIISVNSAFIRDVYSGYYFEGEIHNFWEMVYVIRGNISVSENEKIYILTEGQIVFHKPMEFHRIWADKEQRGECMIVSFSCEGNLIDALGKSVLSLDMRLRQSLTDTFGNILAAFDCTGYPVKGIPENNLNENIAILQFELLLLNIMSEMSYSPMHPHSAGAKNYSKILTVMQNHIDENLSANEIAELCCLGTSNLKKIFKKYAGYGVIKHFNKLRIIRACSLLRSGMSVSEVSSKMSFSSPNYFSTVFKREMGLPPSAYISSETTSSEYFCI